MVPHQLKCVGNTCKRKEFDQVLGPKKQYHLGITSLRSFQKFIEIFCLAISSWCVRACKVLINIEFRAYIC